MQSFLSMAIPYKTPTVVMDLNRGDEFSCGTSPETFGILQDIMEATLISEASQKAGINKHRIQFDLKWSRLERRFDALDLLDDSIQHHGQERYIYDSCRLAALIHWSSLNSEIPFSSLGHQRYVTGLKYALGKMNTQLWLTTEPEIFVWVCLTGVLAAQNKLERARFLAQAGPALMSLGVERVGGGIAHFKWLTQLHKLGVVSIDSAAFGTTSL
jgi:hypothetical protein